MRFSRTILTILLLHSLIVAFSQTEDCEATLTRGQAEFDAGHFYSIPSILNPCLNNFSNEQRQRANLLLAQTYLLLDDVVGAKRSYIEVLRSNPEFIADPNTHPIDVVYLSKKFTATPVLAWFGKAGVNLTPVRVIHDNDVFEGKEEYSLKTGYQASIGGDYYVLDNFGLRGELVYSMATYEHRSSEYFQSDIGVSVNRQSWINFPLTVMYHDHLGKYRPYGYAGYAVGYLLRDVMDVSIEAISTSGEGTDQKQSPDFNLTSKRNRFNQSIVFGGGVKYKFGLNFIFVDVRYSIGLKNLTNAENLYLDTTVEPDGEAAIKSATPLFKYAYVDDYFRIDNLAFSIGFLKPLYQPRELKRARTRSVAKNIKAQENEQKK